MKKVLKILSAILLLVIVAIIALPFIFEGKITELAKKEINKNVNASVDFKKVGLTLFSSFPNFTLNIDGLTVAGKNEFEKDTLANIDNISVTIGLFSVIKGDNYEVKKIAINSPKIKLKILKNGSANYDISLPESPAETTSQSDESGFNLKLKKVELNNGTIFYHDEELNTDIDIKGLNMWLSGNFTGDATKINANLNTHALNVTYNGIKYLSNTRMQYNATIDADLKNEIYTLGKNDLTLNELAIGFKGSVSFIEDGYNLVLTFNSSNNNFKQFLSLIPAVYATDFKDIKARGQFSIDGSVNGIYNEDQLPSFNINLNVDKSMFQYPDLPKAVTDISIKANIYNPGGGADNTVIDVPFLSLKLGENPLNAKLLIKTPVSDPDLNAKINGELDLASVKDYYPLESGDDLSGVFIADITLNGRLSSLDEEEYDQFVALGSLYVKNIQYKTTTFNEPVFIPQAQLNFSPKYLDLVSFNTTIGESDLKAKGKIENYLAYFMGDGTLKGKLTTESKYFNIDKLLTSEENSKEEKEENAEPETEQTETNKTNSVLEIPDKIDFTMQSKFDKLVYDNLALTNVKGDLSLKKQKLTLKNLQSDIIGGQMQVKGSYSSANVEKPEFDLAFSLKKIDIPTSYDNFAIIRKYLPLAKKTNGKFSTSFNLSSILDQQMNPIYETMNGKGNLSTSKISIEELNTLTAIANALRFDELKSLELDKIAIAFQFVNGKMITKPFDIKYKNVTAKVEGWTGFDQHIGYLIKMNIPRKELGADANKLMADAIKEAEKLGLKYKLPETIKVGISIGGTLSNPTVKTDLNQSGSDLVKQAKEELEKQVRKDLREQADKILAEADKQAKVILAEANKQAKYIRNNADEAIAKLNAESDKQANKLISEAKKQGVLAELAAKEAVKQLRAESDKKIKSLREEADKQADALIKTAKTQTDKIKQEAKKRADDVLKK